MSRKKKFIKSLNSSLTRVCAKYNISYVKFKPLIFQISLESFWKIILIDWFINTTATDISWKEFTVTSMFFRIFHSLPHWRVFCFKFPWLKKVAQKKILKKSRTLKIAQRWKTKSYSKKTSCDFFARLFMRVTFSAFKVKSYLPRHFLLPAINS